MVILLLRLCLFAVAFCGVCCLVRRFYPMPAAFLPVFVCTLTGCVLLLAGLLNFLGIIPPLFVLAGLYGLAYELIRGDRLRWAADPAIALLLALSVYFFFYFYGHYISAGDDFNNWAIVVRVMLRYDRLPRYTDTVILFPSYPTGTAGFLYLVCRILGSESGGTLLFAQTFLMLTCILPLFALVKKNRAAAYGVILLTLALGLTMNVGSAIQSLYVDALLALVCLAGIGIGCYYRDSYLEKWPLLLPIGCFLAVTKGSGLYFSAVLAAQGAIYLWNEADKRKKWRCILGLILIPACLLLLWNRHADLVFEGGLMTRHSTSLRYMLNQTLRKGGGELLVTLKAFLRILTNFDAMKSALATFGLLGALTLLGRATKVRPRFSPAALLLSGGILYVTYLLGLLGMYLFNLPEDTIESFSRYVTTILFLLVGLAGIYLIELLNVLDGLLLRRRVVSLCVTVALLAAFCLVIRPPISTLAISNYPAEGEQSAKELASYMPVRDKETRYLVYIWDGHHEQNYGHRLVHYTAYPAQSDIVCTEDDGLALLDSWTQQYDYFIAFWTDDAYVDYAKAHGLDPSVRLWTREAYEAAWRADVSAEG